MKKTISILLASTSFVCSANALEISEIRVDGLSRVEKETVFSYLNLSVGDDVAAKDLDNALKNLYATSMFEDVNIEMNNEGRVLINLVESPIVSEVVFDGNNKVDDDMLLSELSVGVRSIYSKAKVQEDVNRLLELYRRSGRYKTTVTPKIVKGENNRVSLVYEIYEGPVAKIESLNFVGNKKYSSADLSSVVMSKESKWWRFLSSSETYDVDKTNYDKELLRRYYAKRGFADFRVVSAIAELSPDKQSFVLTYVVDEGRKYKIDDVKIDSQLEDVDVSSLQEDFTFEVGDWYNETKIDKTISKITENLGKQGFAFVNVVPELFKNTQTGTLEVVIKILEGQRIVVNQIDITGNTRTDDEVIRRQFNLVEGDAFNTTKLKDSRKNIENLNYFSKVDMQTKPIEGTNKANVAVDVEEKSTGYFNVGVGFSTIDGFMINGGITENNFRGKGQRVSLNATTSDRTDSYSFSFTEPYFLNKDLSAGIDLFSSSYSYEDEASYDTESTGATLRFGWKYTDAVSQAFRYTYRTDKINNVSSDASQYIADETGERNASVIGQTLAVDKLDSRVNPTDGYYSSLSADFAGAGGDEEYYKIDIKNYKYWTFADDYTLKSWLNAGYIESYGDGEVSLFNRYNMGGKTMRGFAVAGIGARAVQGDDALGGNWMLYTGSELLFPIGLDEMGVKGKAFVDVGMLGKPDGLIENNAVYAYEYSSAPRVSVGFGFGWASPMGQIDIDFGFPVVKEEYDETEVFRINFGTSL